MTGHHVTWPVDRFYWARLDMSHVPNGRPTHDQLQFALERYVPQPLEDLHAAFVSISSTEFIGAALPIEALGDLEDGSISLRPGAVPAFLGTDLDATEFEFLTGRFLPTAAVRWRSRLLALAALAAATLLVLLVAGTQRRGHRASEHIAAVNLAINEAMSAEVPAAGSASLPAELRLEAALRSLRRTRRGPAGHEATNAARSLAAVLAEWPKDSPIAVDSIVVGESSVGISGNAAQAIDVQALADKLALARGSELETPSIRAHDGGFRFDLRLRSKEDEQ